MAIPLHTEPADTAPLWRPENPQNTATHLFLDSVNTKHKLSLKTYEELYEWSVTHYDDFWRGVWDFTGVVGERGDHVIDMDAAPSKSVQWFKDAKLNWAENMLQERSPTKTALIQASESHYAIVSHAIIKVFSQILLRDASPSSRAHTGFPRGRIKKVHVCRAVRARCRPGLRTPQERIPIRSAGRVVFLQLYCESTLPHPPFLGLPPLQAPCIPVLSILLCCILFLVGCCGSTCSHLSKGMLGTSVKSHVFPRHRRCRVHGNPKTKHTLQPSEYLSLV
jgi:hypothetical protein